MLLRCYADTVGDMYRKIPFCIVLCVKERTLKCAGIEGWDFRLIFFLATIHVFPFTMNMYCFQSKKDKSSISPHPSVATTLLTAWNYPSSPVNMGPVFTSLSP